MPKGLRNLDFSFDGTGLTRHGGMVLFHRFCKSLGLRRGLHHRVDWPTIGRGYASVDLLLAQLFALVAGLGRIENIRVLKWNGLLPALLGIKTFPHPVTLRRFLHQWDDAHLLSLKQAHDAFRQHVWTQLLPLHSATLDADTTVLTVYGDQEGAAKGYNPTHRGRKSYAPFLLFENRSGISLLAEWRSGNIRASAADIALIDHALSVLPSTLASTRIRLRADSAFFSQELIDFLDGKRMPYAVVARLTAALRRHVERLVYRPFQNQRLIAELDYHPFGWRKPVRIVVTRRPLGVPADSHQPELLMTDRFAYHPVAVHLPLTAPRAMQFYYRRAQQELIFRELKNDSTLSRIPTRRFKANAFYLELLLWAYDLVTLFQRLCLPKECHTWTLHTIQREIWGLPASLSRTHNKNLLHLPPNFPHQDLFQVAQKRMRFIPPWP